LVVCSIIGIIVVIYKNRQKCCWGKYNKKKANRIAPTHRMNGDQVDLIKITPLHRRRVVKLAPLKHFETNPVDSKTPMPFTEHVKMNSKKEETSGDNAQANTKLDMTLTEHTPMNAKVEMNSMEKLPIES
jgi:hypothetical protein